MTMTTTMLPISKDIQAPPPPTNGGHNPVSIAATAVAAVAISPELLQELKDLQKRDRRITDIGKDVKAKEVEIAKQETVVATAKAKMEEERDALHKLEREKVELEEDLANLAAGGHSEFLPLPKAPAKAIAPAQPQQQQKADDSKAQAEWLQGRFDVLTLAELGVKGALADKLEADGIRNGKELRTWIQKNPRREIKGVGIGGVNKLSELMADRMMAMQAEAKKAAPETTAPASAAPAPKPLEWFQDGGEWSAASNVVFLVVDAPAVYLVAKNEKGAWHVEESDRELLPEGRPVAFESAESAKAWCEVRDRAIAVDLAKGYVPTPAASKAPQPLEWRDGDSGSTYALSRVPSGDAETSYEWTVSPAATAANKWSIEGSDNALLIGAADRTFESRHAAKAACQRREDELLAAAVANKTVSLPVIVIEAAVAEDAKATAAPSSPITAAAELDLAPEELEAAMVGMEVRPSHPHNPVAAAAHKSKIGPALRIRGQLYAVTMAAHKSDSVVYTLHPLFTSSDSPGVQWGTRRQQKEFANVAPEEVRLAGVLCYERGGTAYVFGPDERVMWVSVPRAPAGAKGEGFDDDQILEETVDVVINSPGRYLIRVGERAGGRWAYLAYAAFGKFEMPLSPEEYTGRYESRPVAIIAAADAIQDWVRATLAGVKKVTPKVREQSQEIVRALDALDKKLVAEAQAAPKAGEVSVGNA